MECVIDVNGTQIRYNLRYKNVKNINIRIKPDGTVNVSANRRVKKAYIENYLYSKGDFIINALKKFETLRKTDKKEYYDEETLKRVILEISGRIFPLYEKYCVTFPEIRFKKMKSCWGSCNPAKKILTFSTNLKYAPYECVEYVVYHEFTHFIIKNHSSDFYSSLYGVCPNWKERRNFLKNII